MDDSAASAMFGRLSDWWVGGSRLNKVFVVFNNRRLGVTFGADDYEGNDIRLGSLRRKLADQLGVPVDELQLYQLEPRRKLTSDGAGLQTFGISNNDELLAVHKPKPKPQGPKEQISTLVEGIDKDLGDRMRHFCASPPQDAEQRETEYRILTEVILAAMIKLDDVDAGGDPEVRSCRKEAINKLNIYNKEIDQANAQPLGDKQASSGEKSGGRPENSKAANKKKGSHHHHGHNHREHQSDSAREEHANERLPEGGVEHDERRRHHKSSSSRKHKPRRGAH